MVMQVGVISQVETAALKKAGDNRNTLFDRKLTGLYTPATFVDTFDDLDECSPAGNLMCIVDECDIRRKTIKVAILAVNPSTGEVVYDHFQGKLLVHSKSILYNDCQTMH